MALLLWDWICRQMPCLYSINSWKKHPGETILLRVKSENTIEETVYRERLEEEVINKYSSRFWTWNSGYTGPGVKDEHGTVIPTLGETRGRLSCSIHISFLKREAISAIGFASMNRKVILRCFRLPASICRMCFSRVHRKKRLLMSRKTLWLPIRLLVLFTLSILSVSIDSFKLGKITIPIPLPQACAQLNNPEVRKMLEENIKRTAGIMVFTFWDLMKKLLPMS